jgi:hypothetical protein
VNGRKRHLLVGTRGLVLLSMVHDASIQDCVAAPLLLQCAANQFPEGRTYNNELDNADGSA